jgi:hypothetical protein
MGIRSHPLEELADVFALLGAVRIVRPENLVLLAILARRVVLSLANWLAAVVERGARSHNIERVQRS